MLRMRIFLCTLLCTGLLWLPAAADIYDAADAVSDGGLESTRAILEDFDFREATTAFTGKTDGSLLHNLWSGLLRFITGTAKESAATPLGIAALAVCSGILSTLTGVGGGAKNAAFFACYALTVGLAVTAVSDAAEIGIRAVEDMTVFTQTAVPAMGLLAVSAGAPSGAALQPAVLSAVAAASLIIRSIGIPALYVSLALTVVGNIGARVSLQRMAALVRKCALWMVCGSLTLFTAVLAVTGYGAGTLDGVTMKTAKFAAGSLIPALGSLLAEAADAVTMSAFALKNAAGVAGMVFVLLLMLYPVVRIVIVSLLYRLSAAVCEPVADKRIVTAVNDMGEVLGTLAGMVAASGVMTILVIGLLARVSDMGVMVR